jgi:hypothetical protein
MSIALRSCPTTDQEARRGGPIAVVCVRKGDEVHASQLDEAYKACVNLFHAEQAVPFSNYKDTCAGHLERVKNLDQNWFDLPISVIIDYYSYSEKVRRQADKIHAWVEEAQRWLDEAS